MIDRRSVRVMWLLNHPTARQFEIPMMKRLGFTEFFLPKRLPPDPGFRSGSVDWSEDANLSIPPAELEILNAADWYGEPGDEAWAVANRYFDLLFFILHNPALVRQVARNFRGAAIWRAYGQAKGTTYEFVLHWFTKSKGEQILRSLGARFWFGAAYQEVVAHEKGFLHDRAVFLPVGMQDQTPRNDWTGETAKILFVCPEIVTNSYYLSVYEQFKKDFAGLPYAVGGAQSVAVNDPAVLGFLPAGEFERNMRQYRVMFYHSTDPAHVHYHPFEAVRAGMPVVFMAGSLLDSLGGARLAGRCRTIDEARAKIRRILDGDRSLIAAIRKDQHQLLEPMKPDNCVQPWEAGMSRILDALERTRVTVRPAARPRNRRIAIILPIVYGGGTLGSAKQLAHALHLGSRQAGEPANIVFGHLTDPQFYPDSEFSELPPEIKRRPFKWRHLDSKEAAIAAAYAVPGLVPAEGTSMLLPDDGINHFLDCDLWVVISDRLSIPLLPARPCVLVVHDYIQRYEPIVSRDMNPRFLRAAREAERILVTSRFTYADAVQYAGVPREKLRRLPLILPRRGNEPPSAPRAGRRPYFLWPTNLALHKNHANAAEALVRYFEEMDGQLECRMTGGGTRDIGACDIAHLKPFQALLAASPLLRRRLHAMGELRWPAYTSLLAGAEFLWHPATIDNGSFAVIEAAMHSVPALSSDYPAMREIDEDFQLALSWMDSNDPADMARQLKVMEAGSRARRAALPAQAALETHSVARLAAGYWAAVRECL
jgi:glycosyltransferase involved in cell wall biosynthesis